MSEPSESVTVKMEAEEISSRELQAKRLIVGLDVGTTFSGVAWMELNSNTQLMSEGDRIRTVRAWPTSHGQDRDESKVPTRLIYDAQGKVIAWGYEMVDGIALEWFKLAIVPEKDLPPHLRNSTKLKETRKHMRDLKVTPTQVITEYIQKIWMHAKGEIKRGVGARDFKSMPMHVVITIPAIWGNHQIEIMKDAAAVSILQSRTAGPTTYEFLSEPEAAVQAYAMQLQNKLGKNETVMVPDLGGGTGDAISYEKSGEGEKFYLELKEAAPGDGALCGALFVDEAFEDLLMSKLPANLRNLKKKDPNAWRRILAEQWQHSIKRNFEWKGTGQIWQVILSNLTPNNDTVRLHENEIRDVFEGSVMPAIIRLIKKQIEQVKKNHGGNGPRIILPVGGFGRCPYVLQRLREEFEGTSIASAKHTSKIAKKRQKLNFKAIEVHSETGEMPWTSVCRGACQFGMRAQLNNRLVTSRSARNSVGFIRNEPGSAEEGGIWIPDFGCYMIPDKMTWVVRKGDSINTDSEARMAMFLACDRWGKGTFSERSTFYAHDGDSPPDLFDRNDPGFRKYGVMKITASKPIERLPIEDCEGGERRVFDYYLQVKIVGGSVQITATDRAEKAKVVGELVLPNLDTM